MSADIIGLYNDPLFYANRTPIDPRFSLQSTPKDPNFYNFNVNFQIFCALCAHFQYLLSIFKFKKANCHSNLTNLTPLTPYFGNFTPRRPLFLRNHTPNAPCFRSQEAHIRHYHIQYSSPPGFTIRASVSFKGTNYLKKAFDIAHV